MFVDHLGRAISPSLAAQYNPPSDAGSALLADPSPISPSEASPLCHPPQPLLPPGGVYFSSPIWYALGTPTASAGLAPNARENQPMVSFPMPQTAGFMHPAFVPVSQNYLTE